MNRIEQMLAVENPIVVFLDLEKTLDKISQNTVPLLQGMGFFQDAGHAAKS